MTDNEAAEIMARAMSDELCGHTSYAEKLEFWLRNKASYLAEAQAGLAALKAAGWQHVGKDELIVSTKQIDDCTSIIDDMLSKINQRKATWRRA